jgi:hypothetical protein
MFAVIGEVLKMDIWTETESLSPPPLTALQSPCDFFNQNIDGPLPCQ